jgi:N-acetylglucosaminyldiphosphoundecaprenol N-acetyl-beta-D-mannosaminyltransferase
MTSFTEDLLGYPVDLRPPAAFLDEMGEWVRKGNRCRCMAALNAYAYEISLKDKLFSQALREADWLVPDGIGMVLASRCLGGGIRERVTGADIFYGLMDRLNRMGGIRVFFLGSTEATLRMIEEKTRRDYPNILFAGYFSPPFHSEFSPMDREAMVAAVNASGADVLWVGMTAPKQEKWICQDRGRVKVKFAGAIGAVFDFYTGRVKRAPTFFQKKGLEWLFRLWVEPRRLWRRYLLSSPLFLWHLFRAVISRSFKCL